MKRLLPLLALWLAIGPALAQTPVSPAQMQSEIGTQLPTNNTGRISAQALRGVLGDMLRNFTQLGIDKTTSPWSWCAWTLPGTCANFGTIDPSTGAVTLSGAGGGAVSSVAGLTGAISAGSLTSALGLGTMALQNVNAAGDLQGSWPTVVIAPGAVSSAKMASGAALANLGFTPVNAASKGIANGVASLDGSGFVPIGQLPPAVAGGLAFQGNWNASTNTPTLTSSVGGTGQYYFVSVSGSTNLDGTASWTVGDLVLFSSTIWNKIPGPGSGGAVSSVAGLIGAISAGSLRSALSIPAGASGSLQLNVGGTLAGVAMSGDATISTGGTLTIANGVVTGAKMASGAAVTNIGYTPLNKAGDTATGPITLSDANPILNLFASGNAVDTKYWRMLEDGSGNLLFQAGNDAYAAFTNAMYLTRTAGAATGIQAAVPTTIAPTTVSATVSPLIITQPSGSPGNNTVPSSNLGLQQYGSGTSSGWQPYWNGGGTSFNRVDATSVGAIGQGRIYAPLNFIWSDTVDNGTSDGSVNDPHSGAWGAHQPSNGINTVSGAYYEQDVHAGYTGVRETLRVNLIVDGAPALWNTNPNLVGIRDRVSVLTNQGGAPGALFTNAKGAAFAYNPEVYLASGATDMLEVALFEGNIGINTGASARMLFGSTMVKNSDVAGSVFDAAYEVGAGGATPWQDGLLLTDVHSRFPINTTGSIIRVAANVNGGTPTFTNGMDVSAAAVTGCAVKWATGCLSGSLSLTGTSPGIEHGSTTVGNTPFFDWHSSGNNIDYDVRLAASGGTGSVGNGLLTLTGNFALASITGSTQCLQVDSAGLVAGSGDACNPAWSASSPTPTSTGTLPTAATTTMRWRRVGKTYDINLLWNVTNLGPGTAGAVQFTLPNSATNQSTGSACSFYNSSTGSLANMSAAYINPSDTKLTISFSGLATQGYVASCRFEST